MSDTTKKLSPAAILGQQGGKSTSKRKLAAVRRNLKKARKLRWKKSA